MTLATEPTIAPTDEPQESKALLETWPQNERMRHIPSVSWIQQKLDGDLRQRIELLWSSYAGLSADDPHRGAVEQEFRGVCRALERLSDVAKRHRGHPHPPNELGAHVRWSLSQAVSNLNAVDPETFGKRFPFQTFERSFAEPLWAAMLALIEHVHRLTERVRLADANIDMRLYENLVVLQTPLDPRPIA